MDELQLPAGQVGRAPVLKDLLALGRLLRLLVLIRGQLVRLFCRVGLLMVGGQGHISLQFVTQTALVHIVKCTAGYKDLLLLVLLAHINKLINF